MKLSDQFSTRHGEAPGTFRSYLVGFTASISLTVAAYLFVWRHVSSHHLLYAHSSLIFAIISLAVTQLVVQLVFFLHLGRESKPRWNLLVLALAAAIVLILVLGSLWIMSSLNYRHSASPSQTNSYIIHDEGFKK